MSQLCPTGLPGCALRYRSDGAADSGGAESGGRYAGMPQAVPLQHRAPARRRGRLTRSVNWLTLAALGLKLAELPGQEEAAGERCASSPERPDHGAPLCGGEEFALPELSLPSVHIDDAIAGGVLHADDALGSIITPIRRGSGAALDTHPGNRTDVGLAAPHLERAPVAVAPDAQAAAAFSAARIVTGALEEPPSVTLSADAVDENAAGGTVIGRLLPVDAEEGKDSPIPCSTMREGFSPSTQRRVRSPSPAARCWITRRSAATPLRSASPMPPA